MSALLTAHIEYIRYTDQELLQLLSQGDVKAFDTLYDRYWEMMFKKAFYLLQDRQICKDIVQDIFTLIWENRKKLQVRLLKPYLGAAVKFKIADHIRSGKVRMQFIERATIAPTQAGVEETAEWREMHQILQRAMAALPQKCLEIFTMSREGNLSNREIAERLGISVKTVENQITIAIRKIRSTVGPYLLTCLIAAMLND